jgi:DNA-binding LacI/PurR family transcriptional regulator
VDNLPWGAQSVPSLSTVAPNPEQIGRVIAEYVVAGVSDSTAQPERVSSSFISLIERDSA